MQFFSLKNPNGTFNHPRHGIVPKDKPPNGRQAPIDAHQISQSREQNGIISPELNKVGPYQQPVRDLVRFLAIFKVISLA